MWIYWFIQSWNHRKYEESVIFINFYFNIYSDIIEIINSIITESFFVYNSSLAITLEIHGFNRESS